MAFDNLEIHIIFKTISKFICKFPKVKGKIPFIAPEIHIFPIYDTKYYP